MLFFDMEKEAESEKKVAAEDGYLWLLLPKTNAFVRSSILAGVVVTLCLLAC